MRRHGAYVKSLQRPVMVQGEGVSLLDAQLRPGPQPRRHGGMDHVSALALPRSTKAGASTPATLGGGMMIAWTAIHAQLRPGPQPRRHLGVRDERLCDELRSTKAWALTPATHGLRCGRNHHVVRSTKAGASTPATRARRPRRSSPRCTLN